MLTRPCSRIAPLFVRHCVLPFPQETGAWAEGRGHGSGVTASRRVRDAGVRVIAAGTEGVVGGVGVVSGNRTFIQGASETHFLRGPTPRSAPLLGVVPVFQTRLLGTAISGDVWCQ